MQKKNVSQVKRRPRRRKPCPFCVDKLSIIDYKDIFRLKRFITDRGKIVPKRNSGSCAKHQRKLATAIKRSRYIGFLPYCVD